MSDSVKASWRRAMAGEQGTHLQGLARFVDPETLEGEEWREASRRQRRRRDSWDR